MKPNTFRFSAWLFLRALAVVHLIAFISAARQIGGLAGPHGILPAARLFRAVHEQLGAAGYWELPSLCWWFGTGWFLPAMCAGGIALALLLFAGFAPALCLGLLWIDYLSLACAGQIFFDFQWDALLLETTLLAIFLAPWSWRPGWRQIEPPRTARWLLGWLLFRLMLLSGWVKLASGDPTWRNLTALTFHFETQPLPTPLAWYAHQLPLWLLRDACAAMFAIELLAPFGLFAPRGFRHVAALGLIALQILIALTGNYTFFNLLTVALCLLSLDDMWWSALSPTRWIGRRRRTARWGQRAPPGLAPDHPAPLRCAETSPPPLRCAETSPPPLRCAGTSPAPLAAAEAKRPGPRAPSPALLGVFAVGVVLCTTLEAMADFIPGVAEQSPVATLLGIVAPFRSLNNYGLFAQMTTSRPELIFAGSDDGHTWESYELPHKPGDLARRPDFVAPGQPRLDWQLWFAALGSPRQNSWVAALCQDLLRGTPQVLALFARNPFPRQPPHYVRVLRYDYHFTTPSERARTGNWWKREVLDFYIEPITLADFR